MPKNLISLNRYRLLLPVIILTISAMACRTLIPEDSSGLEIIIPTASSPETLLSENDVELGDESATNPLIDLYARVNPAVVNVVALARESGELVAYSEGSGFVFDTDGNIVTNAHVVYGADELEVTFSDHTTRPAEVIGKDLSSDLAVIHVPSLPEGVTPLILGDDDRVQVGQTVVAIGNPFGFEGTMTRGIVSAIGRTIPALNAFRIPKAIQTDAPINPGNSGGPLLNLQGEVVGINAQIVSDSSDPANSGVGFAIPVSLVKRVVPALISNGSYTWPWLGVTGGSLNWASAQAMKLTIERGAYLSQVIKDGPSAKAGLQGTSDLVTFAERNVEIGGDVIIAVDGQPVYSFDDLLIYVALNTSPGQNIVLRVIRNGEERDFTVTLEPRPEDINFLPQPESTPQQP